MTQLEEAPMLMPTPLMMNVVKLLKREGSGEATKTVRELEAWHLRARLRAVVEENLECSR